MTALPKPGMTVDEFLAWSATATGRWELVEGRPVAMAPERARHAATKFAVQAGLAGAIRSAGVPCRMLPDGMTVRIDARTAYEPDALVYCGAPIDPDAVEVPEPVIVVEVLSPGTGAHDTGAKLAGYFRVASVGHYLIVDPLRRIVVHHRRAGDVIETRIVSEGGLGLDPPGITVSVGEMFADG